MFPVTRMPVGADDVKGSIRKRDALSVQFERSSLKTGRDQWDDGTGDNAPIKDRHRLGRLRLVIDHQTPARKTSLPVAGDAAEVAGFFWCVRAP